MGFNRLNAMQDEMLEVAASGHNTLLLSPTGSGKTVAFLLPLLAQSTQAEVRAMIVVPSRELAQQIAEVARKLSIRCVLCYGGHDVRIEIQRLASNPPFIIGTSGRIKDHIERGRINPGTFSHLVLDEYDKSLELGFEEEIKFIVNGLKNVRQKILTSATHAMPIANYLNFKPYEQISYLEKVEARNEASQKYEQQAQLKLWQVKSPVADKLESLRDLLRSLPDQGQAIVFANYREAAERIAHYLQEEGIGSALYHGGMEQDVRDKALIRFRQQSVRVLVSTDLASRGLDIPEVSFVIHYHLPADEEAFTHRNGRTARAGSDGHAFLLLGPNEFVPAYLSTEPEYWTRKPAKGPWHDGDFETVYIGRGKREKISKGDILGFFTKNGGISGAEIGRIDVMEHCAYCAIRRGVVGQVLEAVRGLKIKGEKTLYKIVNSN